jgi:hypothetical protein
MKKESSKLVTFRLNLSCGHTCAFTVDIIPSKIVEATYYLEDGLKGCPQCSQQKGFDIMKQVEKVRADWTEFELIIKENFKIEITPFYEDGYLF